MVMTRGGFTHPGWQTLVRIPFDHLISQSFDDVGDSASKSCTYSCPSCFCSSGIEVLMLNMIIPVLTVYTQKRIMWGMIIAVLIVLIACCGRDLFFLVHINVELFCTPFIEEPKYTVNCSLTLKNDNLSTVS
jgi:hypothetical protein